MAISPENQPEEAPEKPTEFDVLEQAMASYSTLYPGDEQSDETGLEIARIQNIRDVLSKEAHLPKNGFTSEQWDLAMRLMITHGLPQEQITTKMLQYFQRQSDAAKNLEPEFINQQNPTVSKPLFDGSNPADIALMGSGLMLAVGLLVSGGNAAEVNRQIDSQFPILSSKNIGATEVPKVIDIQAHSELIKQLELHREQQKMRSEIYRDKLSHQPMTWVAGAAAGIGALGSAFFGAIKVRPYISSKRQEP